LIKEAIILAGGFGTRLRDAIPDLPKCMAPVNGRPFLFYVINYLRSQGIEKFIFSLGYKHEVVEAYLYAEFSTLDFQCLIEKEPLGTGGAILASSYKTSEQTVLVVNGDTIFKVDLEKGFADHVKHDSDCTLLLKPMENFDRYGVVELNEDDSIKSFEEKKFYKRRFDKWRCLYFKHRTIFGRRTCRKIFFSKKIIWRNILKQEDIWLRAG
jgi:D-glycero-alpha-D-manno-heptose 1-phosphate guanylyltransferase